MRMDVVGNVNKRRCDTKWGDTDIGLSVATGVPNLYVHCLDFCW